MKISGANFVIAFDAEDCTVGFRTSLPFSSAMAVIEIEMHVVDIMHHVSAASCKLQLQLGGPPLH
jgi:hypothetical protein